MDAVKPIHHVFVGLGNPGRGYASTRHNLGFMVVQALAKSWGCHFHKEEKFKAQVAKKVKGDCMVHLLLPMTYMNESGQAVSSYLRAHKLRPNSVVVVCDEVNLPFGRMRLKPSGSAGGHNGLKSIEAHLQTRDYVRLRMGVGADPIEDNPRGEALSDYVLEPFAPHERSLLEPFIAQGVKALEGLLIEDLAAVMNKININVSKGKPPLEGAGEKA